MMKLSPLDALNELDRASAEANGNRAFHLHIMQCAKRVADALMESQVQEKIAAAAKDPTNG